MTTTPDWWQTFFDADYLRLWEGVEARDRTAREVEGLWTLLGLAPGAAVLDAPCGYGRIARALAERGARVVGADFSHPLLAEAERRRGDLTNDALSYVHHDLRKPLKQTGFDVALNIFSSLGYSIEADDVAVLSTLRAAVRPGGLVFLETNHRDSLLLHLSKDPRFASRLPDGTLMVEEPRLDPIAGRIETTWYFSGPSGSGQKSASLRIYTATELVKLLEAAGLEFCSAHAGCSPDPFVTESGPASRRLGLLARRP